MCHNSSCPLQTFKKLIEVADAGNGFISKYNKYAHSFMCIFPFTLLFVCNSQLNSPTCNLGKCEMCEKHTVCTSETPVAQYCSRINSNYWTFCAHLILCSRVLQGTESSKHISHKSRVTGLFPRSRSIFELFQQLTSLVNDIFMHKKIIY